MIVHSCRAATRGCISGFPFPTHQLFPFALYHRNVRHLVRGQSSKQCPTVIVGPGLVIVILSRKKHHWERRQIDPHRTTVDQWLCSR